MARSDQSKEHAKEKSRAKNSMKGNKASKHKPNKSEKKEASANAVLTLERLVTNSMQLVAHAVSYAIDKESRHELDNEASRSIKPKEKLKSPSNNQSGKERGRGEQPSEQPNLSRENASPYEKKEPGESSEAK